MVEDSADKQTTGSSGQKVRPGTRCVVLIEAGRQTPVDLIGGLSMRGVSTTVVTDPAEAMVELARHRTGALVVVDPDRCRWLDDLTEAVRTYHARTVRWGYFSRDASGVPQLRSLESDHGQPTLPMKPVVTEQHDPQPRYIVPDPKSPLGRAQSQIPRERVRSLVVKVRSESDVDEPLISEEELAMLLGPTPEQEGGAS